MLKEIEMRERERERERERDRETERERGMTKSILQAHVLLRYHKGIETQSVTLL